MLDGACAGTMPLLPPVIAAQRSSGTIRLAVRDRDGETVLDRLHQSGPLRARIIRPERDVRATAVLLNTAGGVAGGDDLQVAIEAGERTTLVVANQGAERIYRAAPEDAPSRILTRIRIAAGAEVEYLPQETIVFDNATLDRELRIEMAGDARFLGIEALVFGRAAMGEVVTRAEFRDRISLLRDGRLVFRDALQLPEAVAAALRRRAVADGAAAVATILMAARDAAERLDAVREALASTTGGASAWNGLLLVRLVAQDGAALRQASLRVLSVMRAGRSMPRVWNC